MVRRLLPIVFLAAASMTGGLSQFVSSAASFPDDYPEPQHFVTLSVLEPKHTQILPGDEVTIRVKLDRCCGIDDRGDVKLYVQLDGQNLSWAGEPTAEPHLALRRGESGLRTEPGCSDGAFTG